jgi:kinesin family protein 4/21/27
MDIHSSDERRRRRKPVYEQDSFEVPSSTRFHTMTDRLYDEKLGALKEAYDRRLSSLSEHVQQFFAEAVGDEIYKAMKESRVSSSYAKDRLGELLYDCMSTEAEASISELQNALASAKLGLKRLEGEHQRTLANCSKLEDSLNAEIERSSRLSAELRELTATADERLRQKEQTWSEQLKEVKGKAQTSRSLAEKLNERDAEAYKLTQQSETLKHELERARATLASYEQSFNEAKQEAQELNSALSQAEAIIQDKDKETLDLRRRKTKLKEAYAQLTSEAQQLASDRDTLIEKCASFEKEVYSTLQQEQKTSFDKSKRFKVKLKQMKRKLTEQIEYSEQLEAKLQETQRSHQEIEGSLKQTCDALQSSLQSERDQWRKKLGESSSELSMKEADLASKHSLQVTALQSQYQKMLDTRVAEMQRDMESQLSRGKKLDEELHSIMEARLREVERDTISKLKHDNILNEKLREATREHKAELQEVKAQLERSNLEAMTQAQQELTNIRQDWERQRTEREEKLSELRGTKASLAEELGDFRRENANLMGDLAKIRGELESVRDLKSAVSRELMEVQGLNSGMTRDLERTKGELSRVVKDKEHLEEKLADAREELDRKVGQLYQTEAHFETTFNQLTEEHETADQQKRQRLTELEGELKDLSRERMELEVELMQVNKQLAETKGKLQDLTTEEQARHDGDHALIDDYRSRLMKSEFVIKQLEDDKQHLNSRVMDLKATVKAADAESLRLRDQLGDAEAELSEVHGELSGLARSESQVKAKLGTLTVRAKAEIRGKAHSLKKELKVLKSSVDNEFSATVKHIGGMFEAVLSKFIDISDQHRSQYEARVAENSSGLNKTWKHRLHKAEKDLTTQSQSTIKGLEDKAMSLERTVGDLKLTRQELVEALEKEKRTSRHAKRELERVEEMLRQNSQAFDLLNAEVQEEAERIHRQAETQVEMARRDLRETHQAEIEGLQGQISDLQREISKLQVLSSERLAQLKSEQLGDAKVLKQKYDEKLDRLERALEAEKTSKAALLTDNAALEDEITHLKKDHQSALGVLQDQLKREKQDRSLEIDRLLNYRAEAVKEIEDLTRRLIEQQREADEKAEQASKLARENREQFNKIKDLENRFEMQSRELLYSKPSLDYNEHFKSGKLDLEPPEYKSKTRGSYRSSENFGVDSPRRSYR